MRFQYAKCYCIVIMEMKLFIQLVIGIINISFCSFEANQDIDTAVKPSLISKSHSIIADGIKGLWIASTESMEV